MENTTLRIASVFVALLVWFGGLATAGETVPVKGRLVGKVEVTPLSITEFRLDYTATGVVSHLGRTNATLSTPLVSLDGVNQQLIVTTHTWSGTLTAANGDQIFGLYATPQVVDFTAAGDYSVQAVLEIINGTGRFKNARGQGSAIVTGNIFNQTFTSDIDGWISTVGSSKK